MPENSDPPKSLSDNKLSMPPPNWRPGLEPIPLFDEASSVKLEVEILEESYRELVSLMKSNEWGTDEGLRTVFLAGLGFEIGQRHLNAIAALSDRATPALTERVDVMVNELASYHSMYSVLKFKAFKQYKLNQVLEFNISGLRAQEELWQEWAARMRRDKEELQTEVMRLRSILAEFKLDWDKSGAPPLPPGLAAAAKDPHSARAETPLSDRSAEPEEVWPASVSQKRGFWAQLRRFLGHGG